MKSSIKIKRKVKKTVKKAVGLQKDIPRKPFSKKTKDEILHFQNNHCAFPGCRVTRLLEADHIRGRDDNTFENCQFLCPYHHALKTKIDKKKLAIGRKLRKEEKLEKEKNKKKKKS
tara:strand:+ start:87 stop:434 length:348 start_codon:yes stop_codon:yes gene_type:complete